MLGSDSPVTDKKVHSPSQSSVNLSTSSGFPGNGVTSNTDLVKGAPKSIHVYTEEKETKKLGKQSSIEIKSSVVSSEVSLDKEEPSTQREEAISWNMGPGFNIAQLWAKERASVVEASKIDRQEIFTVPVGVKSSYCSTESDNILSETAEDTSRELSCPPSLTSGDDLSDVCLNTAKDIYNSALTILKGRNVDESRKLGVLSVRAASMLESERELKKIWTPMTEMQYRGGTYRGRCQGGLPEGKGHLTFMDGSFYDGLWRCGKRSGLGTFCYSNGDVFQGSWRDDLMHGKGWFYFHTGDRWFANFWKGKANGEGRFYSKNGSIFFGHFKKGWRHGRGLCIDIDGSRWIELWDEGVLVKRTEQDSEAWG